MLWCHRDREQESNLQEPLLTILPVCKTHKRVRKRISIHLMVIPKEGTLPLLVISYNRNPPFLRSWISPCCINYKWAKMPCDQIGKLLMAQVLITVSSLLNFCIWTHINHVLFILKRSQKEMSIIVISGSLLSQLAHKKIRYHPPAFHIEIYMLPPLP